ncbi:hypothetical protein HPT25_27770 [Bacillus sp. BRMEA1]|uniref:hypothetical protein n=1 Tax=Neobacillus endophyticus TaxID=2738405 RepID=UPI0015638242|nr:hypothetical protein [Neobacillus endophyticus]NRD81095.1 hypothetical protein [Neobacillus endophyticus]
MNSYSLTIMECIAILFYALFWKKRGKKWLFRTFTLVFLYGLLYFSLLLINASDLLYVVLMTAVIPIITFLFYKASIHKEIKGNPQMYIGAGLLGFIINIIVYYYSR